MSNDWHLASSTQTHTLISYLSIATHNTIHSRPLQPIRYQLGLRQLRLHDSVLQVRRIAGLQFAETGSFYMPPHILLM